MLNKKRDSDILAFKFGTRLDGELSPTEGIEIYLEHARNHGGNVLFTTEIENTPKKEKQINEMILMTKDGKSAIKGEVVSRRKSDSDVIPKEFTVPFTWKGEKIPEMAWFALSNVERMEGGIKRGKYIADSGKDLLESMSGKAYMVYVAHSE